MALTIVHERLLKSLHLAHETEIELYEHLRDLAHDFVELKEEVANAGFNIKKWVRENLPRSYEWLQSHVRLYAEWDKFMVCLKWSDDAQYPRNERPSLQVAYDLMDEFDRNAARLRSCRQHLGSSEERKDVIPAVANPAGGTS